MLVSDRQASLSWGPLQATGPPDATPGRDDARAWASLSQDSQREWLVLTYPKAVVPRQIQIHETYCPGAVDRITVFDETGREHEVWRGQDPVSFGQPSGVANLPVLTDIRTRRIKVHIDSPTIPGWNEVDAVGLVDADGKTWWASDAEASSTYAQQSSGGASSYAGVLPLVPRWGNIARPSEAFATGQIKQEQRWIEAFGLPMLAMWGERGNPAPPGASGMTTGITVYPPGGFRTGAMPMRMTAIGGPSGKQPVMLPLRPIWTGLAVDAVFWGFVAWGLVWVAVKPRRFFREMSRMRRGCCLQCGYQLNYDFIAGCPECGWRRV